MPAVRERTTQDDFSTGLNRDVTPHLIDESAAYDFLNLVLDDDGSAYKRGGSVPFSVNDLDNPGRFLFDGILGVGRRTIAADVSKTYVLGADDETLQTIDAAVGMPYPKQTAVMKGLLFIGGGAITGGARSSTVHNVVSQITTVVGSRTVTRSGGTWSGIVVPGHLMKISTGRVYEVQSVESGTSLTLREPYQGPSLTTQSGSFYPIYRHVSGDPYQGSEYVWVSNNRLVYAEDQIIRFSEIDNPHSFPAENHHELPTEAKIIGGTDLGGTSLIFTTDGIWSIEGLEFNIVDANGDGQHSVHQFAKDVILAGIAGIAGHAQQLIIPATDGIYLMDGVSTPVRISRGVERLIRAWWAWGARCGKGVVYRSHYILPIVSGNGTVKDMLVCRIDRPVKTRFGASWPWVRFGGDGGEIPAFAVRYGDTQITPRLLGIQGRADAKVVDCSDFFNPDSENATDSDGTTPVCQIVTRDYESGALTENVVRLLRLRYVLKGGSLKVEWSPGGENYDVAGYSNPLRGWGDLEGEWGHPDGSWGSGFGPADPDVITPPPSAPVFHELTPPGESDGIRPVKCTVGKRARYSRIRITCSGSVETFRLRALETFVRPSQAVRR